MKKGVFLQGFQSDVFNRVKFNHMNFHLTLLSGFSYNKYLRGPYSVVSNLINAEYFVIGYNTEELLKSAASLYWKMHLRYAMAVYEDILKKEVNQQDALIGLGEY